MRKEEDASQRLDGQLIKSIKVKGLGDIAKEYGELGLDLVIDSEILRGIPIISTLINVAKVIGSVRDRLYLKKLLHFFEKIGDTTQEERERFIEKNCKDSKLFEEAVLLILEQADNMNKSSLIGKTFKACIKGVITYDEALKLSDMINKAYWSDLNTMMANDSVKINEDNQSLFTAGFYRITNAPTHSNTPYGGGGTMRYGITSYGKKMIEISKM
jgi:hypothetical protein